MEKTTKTNTYLGIMFEKQIEFQRRLGQDYENDIRLNQIFINNMTQALFVELAESLQETNFKAWKKPKPIEIDKYKEELVDCWHFLINLSLASGMDSNELFDRFMLKNNINNKRQDNGY